MQDFINSSQSNKVKSSLRAFGITEGKQENILNIYHVKRNHNDDDDEDNTPDPDSQSLVVVKNFIEDTLKKVEKELQNVTRKLIECLNNRLQILPVVIEASEAFHDLRSQEVLPLMKSKLNILIKP